MSCFLLGTGCLAELCAAMSSVTEKACSNLLQSLLSLLKGVANVNFDT